MRWIDTQVAFPGLLIALIILAVIGPSLPTVILVLAFNGWMVYGRMTRGLVLAVRLTAYVEAAEVVGSSAARTVFRHILPNLTSPLLTLAILEFARIVLAEAALLFLGMGIQPPDTSWGLDVASLKNYMFRAWWRSTGCRPTSSPRPRALTAAPIAATGLSIPVVVSQCTSATCVICGFESRAAATASASGGSVSGMAITRWGTRPRSAIWAMRRP
jgi:hypothetical protein